MISRIIWTVLNAIVVWAMVSMTLESYQVNPIGSTVWFGLVALLSILFLVAMFGGACHEIEIHRTNKAKQQANYERVFLTDFQKTEVDNTYDIDLSF